MKRYAVEVTHTPNSLNDMFPQGYQESYIRKGDLVVKSKDFFRAPAFWSEYLYTSKKRAERSMKIIQENIQKEPWAPLLNECCDVSFRIVEIEAN